MMDLVADLGDGLLAMPANALDPGIDPLVLAAAIVGAALAAVIAVAVWPRRDEVRVTRKDQGGFHGWV